jgi:hypothetical protein
MTSLRLSVQSLSMVANVSVIAFKKPHTKTIFFSDLRLLCINKGQQNWVIRDFFICLGMQHCSSWSTNFWNKNMFPILNSLFSKKRSVFIKSLLKWFKFKMALSNLVCPKSGIKIASSVKESFIPYLMSNQL